MLGILPSCRMTAAVQSLQSTLMVGHAVGRGVFSLIATQLCLVCAASLRWLQMISKCTGTISCACMQQINSAISSVFVLVGLRSAFHMQLVLPAGAPCVVPVTCL